MSEAGDVRAEPFMGLAAPLRWVVLGLSVLVLGACQSAPGPKDNAASGQSTTANPTSSAKAAPGKNAPYLSGVDDHLWATAIGSEMTFSRARAYCGGLPPHPGGGWRIPSYYQLARAPLNALGVMDGAPLWTDSAPDRLPLNRYFIDPARPFAKVSADLRNGVRYRTVCMGTPAP